MKLLLTSFLFAALNFPIYAQSKAPLLLTPFPNRPQFSFDSSQDTKAPPCAELITRLQTLQNNNREAHFGLIEFMDMSGQKVKEWHGVLAPLEGSQTEIPSGSFDVLIQGSQSIFELTSLAYENLDYLDRDFESILQSLEVCMSKGGN